MVAERRSNMLRHVNLTSARNLSPLFDEAVRQQNPVVIVRGGRERGLLVSRDEMLRVLEPYRLSVDVIPENDGRFTLWLAELEVSGSGTSLAEARQDFILAIRSFVANYLEQFDFYRYLPDLARLKPFVLRLALTETDEELTRLLFGLQASSDSPPLPETGSLS